MVRHMLYESSLSFPSFLFVSLWWNFEVGLAEEPMSGEYSTPFAMERSSPFSESGKQESSLSITVVGASGDLARKKIFPALFALFYEHCLPEVLLHFPPKIFHLITVWNELRIMHLVPLLPKNRRSNISPLCCFNVYHLLHAEFHCFWLCANQNDWRGAEKHD